MVLRKISVLWQILDLKQKPVLRKKRVKIEIGVKAKTGIKEKTNYYFFIFHALLASVLLSSPASSWFLFRGKYNGLQFSQIDYNFECLIIYGK